MKWHCGIVLLSLIHYQLKNRMENFEKSQKLTNNSNSLSAHVFRKTSLSPAPPAISSILHDFCHIFLSILCKNKQPHHTLFLHLFSFIYHVFTFLKRAAKKLIKLQKHFKTYHIEVLVW